MRINAPKTYKAYREWLLLFAEHLRRELPSAASEAIFKYIDCADRFDGTPQHNNPEWFDAACRGGFLNDIPGVVSESLTCIHLARIYGKRAIHITQDKSMQTTEKVDVIIYPPDNGDIKLLQNKTGRFEGNYLYIEPDWTEGSADWVAITDIDDRETYVVDRMGLLLYSGKKIHARDLRSLSIYHFNHRDLMKGL